MSNSTDQDDLRVNASVLAVHERRVLQAIACRLPAWCTPNGLTLLGVLGSCVVVLGYWLSHYAADWLWLANLGLVIHWLGDSLDGTLARWRNIERPRYGFYLDQVIDTFGNTLIAVGVGLAPWVRMDSALIVLAVYHMLSVQVFVRAIVDREFHLAVGRLGPTEMRLGIVLLNCGVIAFGEPPALVMMAGVTAADVFLVAVAFGLLMLFAMQMKGHLSRFGTEDPPRKVQQGKNGASER